MSESGSLTVSEAGRLGGCKTRDAYGTAHYQAAGQKGGQKVATDRGAEYYQEIGRKGGQRNAEKFGRAHFSEIGKKGAAARKARREEYQEEARQLKRLVERKAAQ